MTREAELYKDKIEVSLDGRQVFYLFFGGAIVMCLVFVLGVMVGKRVEARAHLDRAATSAVRDPLAALDRLAADNRQELSFRHALTGGAAPASEVDRVIAQMGKVREEAAKTEAAKTEAGKAEAGKAEVAKAEAAKAEAAKTEAGKTPASGAEKKTETAAGKSEPAKPNGKNDVAKAEAPKAEAPKPDAPKAEAPKAETPKAEAPKKARFALQLSAFQDKAEAEAFLAEIKSSGYQAFITEANVPEKGTFYRVRLGGYATYDEAMTAKDEFERKVKKIAYVSRL